MKSSILHVAVDNDVFAKLPRFCLVDHSFRYMLRHCCDTVSLVQRRIVNILCNFCGKSFPSNWGYDSYERHWTCTNLEGTGCYLQAKNKMELLATRCGTMTTASD